MLFWIPPHWTKELTGNQRTHTDTDTQIQRHCRYYRQKTRFIQFNYLAVLSHFNTFPTTFPSVSVYRSSFHCMNGNSIVCVCICIVLFVTGVTNQLLPRMKRNRLALQCMCVYSNDAVVYVGVNYWLREKKNTCKTVCCMCVWYANMSSPTKL